MQVEGAVGTAKLTRASFSEVVQVNGWIPGGVDRGEGWTEACRFHHRAASR